MNFIRKSLILALAGMTSLVYAEKIKIEGSTTVLPIAQAAAEAFMGKNSDTDITVRGGGSGVGIASLMDGICDIGNSSRPVKQEELDKAVSKGKDLKSHMIALDGICVVIHPENTVKNLSLDQIKDIFTGKITDWSEVGGSAGKIVAVSRDSSSGTYEAFGELALKKAKVRADALMQASNQAVASVIESNSSAIGYIGLGYITPGVKAVTVEGITASRETVLSGKYAISRPLFMYTNGTPAGAVKQFIDFIKSPEGQKIVQEQGFVALS